MLLFGVLLFAVQWTASTLAGIGPSANCCNKVTNTKTEVTKIVKYVLQDTALCPVKAVRFTTITHNTVCSDPESKWAKFAMCVVDKSKSTSKAEAVAICRGSTTVNWTKPPMTTTPMPVTSKSTASKIFTTPSLPTVSTTARYTTQSSSVTTEPPTTTRTTQRTTPGTTQGTSTEMRTTTLTTVTTVTTLTTAMSQTPPVESEASTSSMTTSHTVTSKKTPEPTQQFPWTTIPPAQRSTPTVTVPSTHSPSLTSTQTQNPSETSTITTAASKETPKVTRLPWTLKRLKKKSKSGLRKAQRRRG